MRLLAKIKALALEPMIHNLKNFKKFGSVILSTATECCIKTRNKDLTWEKSLQDFLHISHVLQLWRMLAFQPAKTILSMQNMIYNQV